MSILIDGIKMPTSCAECPMGSVLYGYKCLAKNKQFDRYAFTSMQDWCPLIEIPDKHGRLIDADALIADIRANSESYFADDFAHEWIDVAPTIIEAKEDE